MVEVCCWATSSPKGSGVVQELAGTTQTHCRLFHQLLLSHLLLKSLSPDFTYVREVWTRSSGVRVFPRAMSFAGSFDEGARSTDSAHAIGPLTPVSPNSKVQTAWKYVRSSFKAKTSMPELKRWLSHPRASESVHQGEERRLEDEEPSLFCESLLGLMQRTGRFDYLDYSKDEESAQKEKEKEKEKVEKQKETLGRPLKLKRLSWSR